MNFFNDPRTLAAFISAFISSTSIFLTIRFWRASNRPIVAVTVVTDEPGSVTTTFNLVVANAGNRPAVNIRLLADEKSLDAAIDPDANHSRSAVSMVYDCFSEAGLIPLLLNGREVSNGFGGVSDQEGQKGLIYGSKIPVTVTYFDLDGRSYSSQQVLLIKASNAFAGSWWEPKERA